ncbi:ribonuclease D [Kineobactrum salinum]|uniref:Ribonuclease D n=1 Tax=Kineobactrum salinum TaxID=2708301 RepID=A0A6C0UBC0_9GAMM|nr:ribonuclease D [Kineobactrum salinum]QIB67334.1 ribonuclease D [Kineobactrum salinum]
MKWQLIESDAALAQLVQDNSGAEAVAVDTEFMRRNTFYPEVALVQLCFGPDAWLIDPLTLTDLQPLRELLLNPSIIKVLHSASEDLEVFDHWLGTLPAPLFDTQRAAALVNRGFGMGYRALVLDICGVELPKGETRSDWLQRPLTASQCEYAAQDVAHLLPVWRHLQEACVAQGKLDWVLADGEDTLAAFRAPAANFAQRIKSAWKLDQRQLASLYAICDWRERVARQRNKPRGWIIDDQTCFELARLSPDSQAGLAAVEGLGAGVIRRDGETLLTLLREQRALPPESLPQRLPQPLDVNGRKQLSRLKARARSLAQEHGVAPEVLLQGKDYELLLRQAAGEELPDQPSWSGWRRAAAVAPLRRMLAGDQS